MEDPRKTRAQRLQTSLSVEGQEILQGNDAVYYSSPFVKNDTTFFYSYCSASPSDILESQSGGNVHSLLETGVTIDDALYISDVNDVACMDDTCNKRISDAGLERSAGRPGHTPTRWNLACEKTIEDSCAGQDWSAGRLGNRPFGVSSAACPSLIMACLGPYGTASRQPHHTGPNTREETYTVTSSTGRPRYEDSTSQFNASSSQRPSAAEGRVSLVTVALHPRRPPYFCGGHDEDVHIWTSIVSRWLETIQGEPSRQMTFVVSLLRGAAYEWYQHHETRTGCPGEKARAGLRQLNQDKMTILQNADAFESYLAQLGEYDESYYLTHFIFGLRPEVMRGVYI